MWQQQHPDGDLLGPTLTILSRKKKKKNTKLPENNQQTIAFERGKPNNEILQDSNL